MSTIPALVDRAGAGTSVKSAFVSTAGYPNFAGKPAEEAILSPAGFTAYLRHVGVGDCHRPPGWRWASSDS